MRQAVDMWTMRWSAPAPAMDNAAALPTAGAFDHMTTAPNYQGLKNSTTPRCGADTRLGWVRFTSAAPRQSGSDLLRR